MVKRKKKKCQAHSVVCSDKLVRTVSVNGSQAKKGKTFRMCAACRALLGRTAKIEDAT